MRRWKCARNVVVVVVGYVSVESELRSTLGCFVDAERGLREVLNNFSGTATKDRVVEYVVVVGVV